MAPATSQRQTKQISKRRRTCFRSNEHVTYTRELLEAAFSMLSVPRIYKQNHLKISVGREYELQEDRQPARTGAAEHRN
jgi:hypothetical protein